MDRFRAWVCSWYGHAPWFEEDLDGIKRRFCTRCGDVKILDEDWS